MKTPDAFNLILEIENSVDTSLFTWNSFNTWPLIRKIIWFKLISSSPTTSSIQEDNSLNIWSGIKEIISLPIKKLKRNKIKQDSVKIFFSRPEYLQEISSSKFIDRIVDPIIDLSSSNEKMTKYYLYKISKEKKLIYEFFYMNQETVFDVLNVGANQEIELDKIAVLLKIDRAELKLAYTKELREFLGWYYSAKSLLSQHKKLKEIYVTCWYLPDMMGICAAASELGIRTIDIQHGKQGKYQAMYSGWTNIPSNGYDLMPEKFWCWGKPSCNHILDSSPNRTKHIPFVGGYPWINYYLKNIAQKKSTSINERIRVLLTMQPPQGDNHERIPNFIIKFLKSKYTESVHFIFRLHPNDTEGKYYCNERLKLINPNSYTIDEGKKNLYDLFGEVTHHITAFSSCCYEAQLFNLPTLLYGNDSKKIYQDEIKEKIFSWTDSNLNDLLSWLHNDRASNHKMTSRYIDNSMNR